MAVIFDTAATVTATVATQPSTSLTIGAGATAIITIVMVDTGKTCSGSTWNGGALTQKTSGTIGAYNYYVFYGANPTSGTHTADATCTNNSEKHFTAISVLGSLTTSALLEDIQAFDQTGTGNFTISLTTSNGAMLCGEAVDGSNNWGSNPQGGITISNDSRLWSQYKATSTSGSNSLLFTRTTNSQGTGVAVSIAPVPTNGNFLTFM